MSGLLKKIQNIDKEAADYLRDADLQSDSDIQVLTRDELRDLLPGNKNMKRRRAIFDIIHKQPIDQILKKVKGFIPEESLRAALTDNGVLVEYLGLLMDMKTQMDKVLTVIEAHIDFLNEYKTNPSDHESASSESKELLVDTMDTSPGETPEAGSHGRPLPSGGREEHQIPQSDGPPQAAAGSWTCSGTSHSGDGWKSQPCSRQEPKRTTSYRMVVGGKTFDAHLTLMEKIKKKVHNQLCEDDNHSVTFVFCPISSRVASDVEAAMSHFIDDKPVILVLMHHTHQVRATSTMKTWNVNAKVVLHVNVFYHETRGLLKCDENNAAVTEIGNKLLELFDPNSSLTSGNAQGGGGRRWWD
ncbi:uncharacterized protein LOC119195105 isoform X1 [Pungitius pungitius]|uniref:uncharacterized protein LOC119195105 isoform X1 n=1 Tax=Pungitius pungitius TaxID=134920 RepID=UPI002E125B10